MPQFMSPGDRHRAVSSAMDTFVPEEGRWQYETSCAICKSQFSVFRTRHHCRYCGMSVCGKHSAHKAVVPVSLSVQEQRVCDQCYPKCINNEGVIASRPRRMTVDARPVYRAANHSQRRHINSTLFIDDDNTVKSTSSTRSTRKMSLPITSPSVDDDDGKSVASASTDSTRSTQKMSLPYPYSTSTASSTDERTRSRGSSRAAQPPISSSRGSRKNQAHTTDSYRSVPNTLPPRGSSRGSLPPKKQVRTMDINRLTRKVNIPDPPPPRESSIRSTRAMTVGAQPRDPSFAIRRANTRKPSPIPFREKNTFSDSESDGYSSSDDDMSINDNSDDSIGDEDDDAFGCSRTIRDSLTTKQDQQQQKLPRTSSPTSTAALVAQSPVLSHCSAQEMQLEFSLSEFSLSGISEAASHVPVFPISEARAKNTAALATIPALQNEASSDAQLIGAQMSLSAKRQSVDDEISSLNDSDAEKPSGTFARESYWDDDVEYDGNNGIARFSTVSSTLGASALGASAYRARPSSFAIAEGDEEEREGVFRGDRSFAQKTLTHTLSSTGHRLMRTIQELEKQIRQYQNELPTLLAEYERSEVEAMALEQQANESRQRVAQYRKARALVQRAVRSSEKLMLEQEYLAAILELSRAVKIEPKNGRIWYLLAECRLKVSQFYEAEEACRTCINLKPSTAAVALLARVLHEQGRHAEAIKWYLTAMGRS